MEKRPLRRSLRQNDRRPPHQVARELTKKEKLVVDLYNQGLTYREIAERAVVTPGVIKDHLDRARIKLRNAGREGDLQWNDRRTLQRETIDRWLAEEYLTKMINGGTRRITAREIATAIMEKFPKISHRVATQKYAHHMIRNLIRFGIFVPTGSEGNRSYVIQWPPHPPNQGH